MAAAGKRLDLSVVILARNEAMNLPRCLKAAAFADERVVVDDLSVDGTAAVAQAHGARVVTHRLRSFADQRNWAMANAGLRNEWVLHLDADEVVTPALAGEIETGIAAASRTLAGYLLCRRTVFRGRLLRHADQFPVWVLRLVRRTRVEYIVTGHGETWRTRGEIGSIGAPMRHHNFSKGLSEWIDRHNRYSTDEALAIVRGRSAIDWRGLMTRDAVRRRHTLKALSHRLPLRPWIKFAYMYVFRRGFLDGYPGLVYCVLQAMYEYMICMKVKELRRGHP